VAKEVSVTAVLWKRSLGAKGTKMARGTKVRIVAVTTVVEKVAWGTKGKKIARGTKVRIVAVTTICGKSRLGNEWNVDGLGNESPDSRSYDCL